MFDSKCLCILVLTAYQFVVTRGWKLPMSPICSAECRWHQFVVTRSWKPPLSPICSADCRWHQFVMTRWHYIVITLRIPSLNCATVIFSAATSTVVQNEFGNTRGVVELNDRQSLLTSTIYSFTIYTYIQFECFTICRWIDNEDNRPAFYVISKGFGI